jgi:UDP:flavonoid glycosyltransferase YjiC (YdhE family)
LQPARIPVANPDQTRISKAVWSVLGKLFVAPTNSFRKRVGAPRVQDFNAMLSKRLLLLPVSPHVATPDPRWPAYVRQTGYWFPRPQENWQPLADLMDFISKGERPVVVSLGVMSQSGKPARQAALLTLSAILQSGRRAILQGWQETLKGEKIPDTVYLAGSMPHDWLFAQASAVVHHGGFGTTAAALRSGAPSILIPHVIDQFYWGQQVAALGVGPQPITRGKLTAPALTAALQQAAGDPEMQRRAADLGARIRADADGVQEAVRIIGEFNLS